MTRSLMLKLAAGLKPRAPASELPPGERVPEPAPRVPGIPPRAPSVPVPPSRVQELPHAGQIQGEAFIPPAPAPVAPPNPLSNAYTWLQDKGTRGATIGLPAAQREGLHNTFDIGNRLDRGLSLEEGLQSKLIPVKDAPSITGADIAKLDTLAAEQAIAGAKALAQSRAGLEGYVRSPLSVFRNKQLNNPVGLPAGVLAASAYPAYQVGRTLLDTLGANNPDVPALKTTDTK